MGKVITLRISDNTHYLLADLAHHERISLNMLVKTMVEHCSEKVLDNLELNASSFKPIIEYDDDNNYKPKVIGYVFEPTGVSWESRGLTGPVVVPKTPLQSPAGPQAGAI